MCDCHRRGDGGLRRQGIARVDDDLERRRPAAHQIARVLIGYHDRRLRLAARDGPVDRGPPVHVRHDAKVARVLKRLDDVAALGRARFVEHDRGEVAHIGLDGVPEDEQLDHRNTDHHREGEVVPPHLDELFAEHRPKAGHHRSSRSCRITNASSSVRPPTWAATSAGVPNAMRCPRLIIARRAHCSASSM